MNKITNMRLFDTRKICFFSFLLVVLSACSTTSGIDNTRYFSLTPLTQSYTGEPLAEQLTLGIGPVEIPGLLNRPQLVYRKNNNEIKISEENQWAGSSMREEIQKTLIERAIDVSGSQRIMYYPWPRDLWPEYEVRVRIERLDGTPGKEVILEAHWDLLTNKGKDLITSRKSRYEIAPDSKDFLAYVIAQQSLLSNLADEILKEIISYQNNNQ